jgi:hypothetical protein
VFSLQEDVERAQGNSHIWFARHVAGIPKLNERSSGTMHRVENKTAEIPGRATPRPATTITELHRQAN